MTLLLTKPTHGLAWRLQMHVGCKECVAVLIFEDLCELVLLDVVTADVAIVGTCVQQHAPVSND